MSKITYTEKHEVRLDGKLVGEIRKEYDERNCSGFRYYPKGQKKGGELFWMLSACKDSLEG